MKAQAVKAQAVKAQAPWTLTARWECEQCSRISLDYELLHAPNPFDARDTLTGCPDCKSVENFNRMCDVIACRAPATSGTPTRDGYRRTCSVHAPANTEHHKPSATPSEGNPNRESANP